eukprot:558287-Pyramimonas_sp.AAC.1
MQAHDLPRATVGAGAAQDGDADEERHRGGEGRADHRGHGHRILEAPAALAAGIRHPRVGDQDGHRLSAGGR